MTFEKWWLTADAQGETTKELARKAFDAGLERAEEIARGHAQQLVISRACTLVADAIAAERARLAGEREAGR